MESTESLVSIILAVGSLGLGLGGILLLRLPHRPGGVLQGFITKEGGVILFMVAFMGMLSSLVYSEVFGFEPCLLCWYQRIVLYPSAILLGVSLWRKEPGLIFPYIRVLAGIGFIISIYQYVLQQSPRLAQSIQGVASCGFDGPSCFDTYINVFGFVTMPLMALLSFFAIFVLSNWLIKNTSLDQRQ